MYARSTTFEADLSRLDQGMVVMRDEIMPAIQGLETCTGHSLMVDWTSGTCIATTAWEDEDALRGSEDQAEALRERAAEVFGCRPRVDRWEIAVLHRTRPAPPGSCVRVVWTRGDTVGMDRRTESYRAALLPAIEELDGFCSASLLIDRATGRAVSSVTYDSRAALDSTREAAMGLRRTAVEENDVQIEQAREFDLVVAHLRVPETV